MLIQYLYLCIIGVYICKYNFANVRLIACVSPYIYAFQYVLLCVSLYVDLSQFVRVCNSIFVCLAVLYLFNGVSFVLFLFFYS